MTQEARSSRLSSYDNDGAVDLTLTDGYGPVGGHIVFRNALADEARRRSPSVIVLDAAGHHTRFGAEVRLLDQAGRESLTPAPMAQGIATVSGGVGALAPQGLVATTLKAYEPAAAVPLITRTDVGKRPSNEPLTVRT